MDDAAFAPPDPLWVAVGVLRGRFELSEREALRYLWTLASLAATTVEAEAQRIVTEVSRPR